MGAAIWQDSLEHCTGTANNVGVPRKHARAATKIQAMGHGGPHSKAIRHFSMATVERKRTHALSEHGLSSCTAPTPVGLAQPTSATDAGRRELVITGLPQQCSWWQDRSPSIWTTPHPRKGLSLPLGVLPSFQPAEPSADLMGPLTIWVDATSMLCGGGLLLASS